MQAIEGLNETHLRLDRKLHPLVETWIGWRQMYMNNATYAQADRRWLSWTLGAMRRGNIGSLGAAFNWMYTTTPRTLKITPAQIDAIYRTCYRRAVPYFLNAATQTAKKGNVCETDRLVGNAKICAILVGVRFDEENAANLKRAGMEMALLQTL